MSISRRGALSGAATVGLGVPLLAACGGDETTASDPPPSSSTPSQPASSSAGASETAGGKSGSPKVAGLVATSDVPVGGGLVIGEEEVVVTQPTEGEFRAFSAICTHQGCLVARVEDGAIACDCHGSRFSIEDGSVTAPPAAAPLPEVPIEVSGGSVGLA